MYSYYSFLLALITITITASTLLYPPQISHGYSAVDGAGVHIHIKPQNGALLYRYVIKYFSLCSVNVRCQDFAILTFYYWRVAVQELGTRPRDQGFSLRPRQFARGDVGCQWDGRGECYVAVRRRLLQGRPPHHLEVTCVCEIWYILMVY